MSYCCVVACPLVHPQPAAVAGALNHGLISRLEHTVSEFEACTDAKERYQLVLQYAQALPPYPDELKQHTNRVLGCTAQVSCSPAPFGSGAQDH